MRQLGLIIITLLFGCSDSSDKENTKIESSVDKNPVSESENLTPKNSEIQPGEYFEYHPSGGIKIRGFYNSNLNREGLWISYYENGVKWSEAYYLDGKRDGHNITFYPSGKIRFVGEYKDDQKTGSWTFYDEEGVISKIENY